MGTNPRRLLLVASALAFLACLIMSIVTFNAWMGSWDFELSSSHSAPTPADLRRAMFVFYAWVGATFVAGTILSIVAMIPFIQRLRAPAPKAPDTAPWH